MAQHAEQRSEFRHGQAFADSAAQRGVRLDDVEGVLRDQILRIEPGIQAFPARQRDVDRRGEFLVSRILRRPLRERFFEEIEVEFFQFLGERNSLGERQTAVAVGLQTDVRSHGCTDFRQNGQIAFGRESAGPRLSKRESRAPPVLPLLRETDPPGRCLRCSSSKTHRRTLCPGRGRHTDRPRKARAPCREDPQARCRPRRRRGRLRNSAPTILSRACDVRADSCRGESA